MYGDPEQSRINAHVSDPEFGRDPETGKPLDFFERLVELFKVAPKLTPSETQQLLRDRYETFYGIYDHDTAEFNRPFALIAMQKTEDCSAMDQVKIKTGLFIERDVTKYTGLSLTEFFDLPSFRCNEILEICLKKKKDDEKAISNLANAVNGLKNG